MVSASFPVLKTRLSGIIPRNARLRLLTDPWRQHPRAASSIPALGSLQTFEFRHETPHIGTRFPKSVQLSQVLTSPNSDLMLKDLATFVSHRGVVFFENQDIDVDGQKALGTRLGELGGKPATSTLHIYPNDYADSVRNEELPPDVSRITSEGGVARTGYTQSARASEGWHSDTSFEPVPSDYAASSLSMILKMHTLPSIGGDTLLTSYSGYEAYDKLSPAYQRFVEGLTALHDAPGIREELAMRKGNAIYGARGSPENTGGLLQAIHPVVRTHPLTGFKTLFVNKFCTTRILELTEDESADVLNYLTRQVSDNHDLQVRFRWSQNDVAIWDNRCTLHTATSEIDYQGLRQGNRVVSVGEKPYFDPNSKSRRIALGI
ncbi:taurine catabolism dioxygenase [Mycena olivaceomarginata]|nr:taurine catabolism dioxygenase [Mycena olivaceomarginata]